MDKEKIEALNKIMGDKIRLIETYVKSNMVTHAMIELNALKDYITIQSSYAINLVEALTLNQKVESR